MTSVDLDPTGGIWAEGVREVGVLPGEPTPRPRAELAHGGTPDADRTLGAQVWPVLPEVLGLR